MRGNDLFQKFYLIFSLYLQERECLFSVACVISMSWLSFWTTCYSLLACAQVKQRCPPKRVRSDSAKDTLDIKKISPQRRGLCFVHLTFYAKLAFIKYLLNKISLFIPVMGNNIQNIISGEGHMKGKIVTVNKWLSHTTWILLLEAKSVDFLFSFVIYVFGFLTKFSLICQFFKAKEKQREYSK